MAQSWCSGLLCLTTFFIFICHLFICLFFTWTSVFFLMEWRVSVVFSVRIFKSAWKDSLFIPESFYRTSSRGNPTSASYFRLIIMRWLNPILAHFLTAVNAADARDLCCESRLWHLTARPSRELRIVGFCYDVSGFLWLLSPAFFVSPAFFCVLLFFVVCVLLAFLLLLLFFLSCFRLS